MSSVGAQLRQAREAQELTVNQVAEILKVRTDYVVNLEEGEFRGFPAAVYVKGYVRTYARLLKLDEKEIQAQLRLELEGVFPDDRPPVSKLPPKTIVDHALGHVTLLNWRAILLGVSLLTLVICGFFVVRAWRYQKTHDPLEKLGSGVYQPPAAPGPGNTLPLPKK